jgi:glucosamine-6-phosphate deaminase
MMEFIAYDGTSAVETRAFALGRHKPMYAPVEKIPVLEVPTFPLLGRITALRFIEWVQKNRGGVVALPTGKSPEYFIKWVNRVRDRWDTVPVRSLLEEYGIDPSRQPVMEDLRFVQIDEFFPMDASRHNSFHHYVSEFYLKGFGIPAANALLIDATSIELPSGRTMEEVFPDYVVDLSLRVRKTTTALEQLQKEVINRVDEYCMEYESRIRGMGGIGFFLGGIGPDGHIAFNVRGSSIHSVTRLTATNYETQAAAAVDLGGIEISRKRLVITVGLATITWNPSVTAIIIAAGEAKAEIVAQAVMQNKSPRYPATVLQGLPNSRFYCTTGAAKGLVERRYSDFMDAGSATNAEADRIVLARAISTGKPVTALSQSDFEADRFAAGLLSKERATAGDFTLAAKRRMEESIAAGLRHVSGTVFLHTEPHHDDIMLSYLAHIYHLVRDATNVHWFANLTSGFTSVTNDYVCSIVRRLEHALDAGTLSARIAGGAFDPSDVTGRMADVYEYLDGVAAGDEEQKENATACRFVRDIFDVYGIRTIPELRVKTASLHDYFKCQYPGAKDPHDIQTLKGMLREWEVELLWAYFGIEVSSVVPLRLGFYTGDIFSDEPELERDVTPIARLLDKVRPDVVTVALDPEGSGPDTHYKALQAVAAALKRHEASTGRNSIRVWGYRNVWNRFDPSEVNLMVPVSLNSIALLETAFANCFGSQRSASFPSPDHDGPFSELARRIQADQYRMVKCCLGNEYFLKNPHPRLRAAHGMIFLKEMNLPEFYAIAGDLRKITEG